MAGKTILVIEDNLANMELVRDLLVFAGFSLLEATTAEDGLRMAMDEKPDLILMDVGLPGMDGFEATGHLKRDLATSAIPIICVTSHAMAGDCERALAAGCDGYITKPIDTRTFVAEVGRYLVEGSADIQ